MESGDSLAPLGAQNQFAVFSEREISETPTIDTISQVPNYNSDETIVFPSFNEVTSRDDHRQQSRDINAVEPKLGCELPNIRETVAEKKLTKSTNAIPGYSQDNPVMLDEDQSELHEPSGADTVSCDTNLTDVNPNELSRPQKLGCATSNGGDSSRNTPLQFSTGETSRDDKISFSASLQSKSNSPFSHSSFACLSTEISHGEHRKSLRTVAGCDDLGYSGNRSLFDVSTESNHKEPIPAVPPRKQIKPSTSFPIDTVSKYLYKHISKGPKHIRSATESDTESDSTHIISSQSRQKKALSSSTTHFIDNIFNASHTSSSSDTDDTASIASTSATK
ncbi:MAG: hypothetical protein M1834_004235 [Cirrosporium novae-zelandiae]|nr:MAG: hypothetical protein M1834_004235 [Cirrosporium novae-zelandiae]